jgi:Reverse transcriptase (RNA-dependent DNA polymerase)
LVDSRIEALSAFFGYADNHTGNVFRLMYLHPNKIIMSRDMTWSNKTFEEFKMVKGVVIKPNIGVDEIQNKHITEEQEAAVNNDDAPDDEDDEPAEPIVEDPKKKKKLIGELKRLAASCNPAATEQLESLSAAIEKDLENRKYGFIGAVSSDYNEPTHFMEPWDATSQEDREGWRETIKKEFRNMHGCGVLEIVKRQDVPRSRRPIGSKWVFKKKRTGIYRSRLVSLGYSQIPGENFTENFTPVVNDVMFQIIIVMIIVMTLQAVSVGIETVFLHGKLDEMIYIKNRAYPFEQVEDSNCLRLTKSIYRLVQAAQQWWKRFTEEVKKFGFVLFQMRSTLACCINKTTTEYASSHFVWMTASMLDISERSIGRLRRSEVCSQ